VKHTRSSAEWAIREAVVARFGQLWPDARIVHEMNCGGARTDVVAVQPDRLWICEIKSERDTLDRLPEQIKNFYPVCHGLIIAAHEKWTVTYKGKLRRGGYPISSLLADAAGPYTSRFETWSYPEPPQIGRRDWSPPYSARVPWHHQMLQLLWADELREIAARHRISCTSRTPVTPLTRDLSAMMTGREIEIAVCQALRRRTFAEADQPIEAVA